MGRNAFNAIWFIDLSVNVLQVLIEIFLVDSLFGQCCLFVLLPHVLLPVEESTSVRTTFHGTARYDLGWDGM